MTTRRRRGRDRWFADTRFVPAAGADGTPTLPLTVVEAQAAVGLTNLAFWRMDLTQGGDVPSLGNVSGTLKRYGSSVVQSPYNGEIGVLEVNSGDTYSVLFSDATLAPGSSSFLFAWYGAFASDAAGTMHTAIARTNNGNGGWLLYFNDSGDLIWYASDGAGHNVQQTLGTAVCPLGAAPIGVVGQVDWSGGTPELRIRWGRRGVLLGTARVVLTGVTTLTVGSQELGLGGQPGVIASGQTNGSGCWHKFGLVGLPGVQCEGQTKALTASQGLGFERTFSPSSIVIPVGDSITQGVGDETSQGGYRKILAGLRPDLNLVGTQTTGGWGLHEGVSGNTIAQITARLADFRMQGAGVILLLAGTNDVSAGRTSGQILTDLRTLAETLKGISGVSRVLVSKIPPRNVGDGNKPTTDAVNSGMAAAFVGAPSGITVVDVCSMLTFSSPNQFSDTVHPNAAGYAVMGANWAAVI